MKKGFQLYSAYERCQTAQGLEDTIQKIADMGYDGVEFFNYSGLPATKLKQILAQCGIEAINTHLPLARWENNLSEEIEYALTTGIPALTIPWLAPELRTENTYRKIIKNLPDYVQQCEKSGLQVHYHNHDFEFETMDGRYIMDSFLEAAPKLFFEMDTFWAYFAGVDSTTYMQEHADRLKLIHVKDYLDKTTQPPQFCAIGSGLMCNTDIVSKAKSLGVEWVIVEQDNSQIDVLESAKLSLKAICALCDK